MIPDLELGAYSATRKVTEEDQEALAQYQAVFFDEAAADRRRTTQPKRRRAAKTEKAPPVVRLQRLGAAKHITAVDRLLTILLGVGLLLYKPSEDVFDFVQDELPFTLVLHMDEASPGYAMYWFLALKMKLRIVVIRDVFHREWNDVRLALSGSGVWWAVLLTIVAWNMPFGPFASGRFWEMMQDAVRLLVARSGFSNPTFRALYALICNDLGVEAVGTLQHMQDIFDRVTLGDPLTRMGTFISTRRWFDWVDAAFAHEKVWHSRLLAIIVIGQLLGVYRDFGDVPLWSDGVRKPKEDDTDAWTVAECEEVQADQEQAVDDVNEFAKQPKKHTAKDDKASVKSGKEELAEYRKLCRNTVFVSACVACRSGMLELVRLISYLCRPLWNDHTEHCRSIRAPLNTERFYAGAAAGKYFNVLRETVALLLNVEILDRIGFMMDFHLEVPADATVDNGAVVTDDALASTALDIVRYLCRERIGSMLWHSGCWPGLLALMTTGIAMDEVNCLALLRADFRNFLDAVIGGVSDVVLKKIVDGSCFQTTLVKDIAEVATRPLIWPGGFRQMIVKLVRMARALYAGWGQTKVVEDTNRVLRDRETRDVNNRRLSMINYWSAMRGGKTIALHDREEISPHPDTQGRTTIPAGMFSSSKHTVGLQGTEAITGSTTWRSYSPQSAVGQYAHLVLLRYLASKGPEAWNLVGRVWMACLFRKGDVIRHTLSGRIALVLDPVGACAVLCWGIEEHNEHGVQFFTLSGPSIANDEAVWMIPLNLAEYEVIPVKPISPAHLWLKLGREIIKPMGVVLLASKERVDIWTWAAQHAFWNLGLPQLQKFSKF